MNGDAYSATWQDAEIPHYVRLTKDYYMGVFEVTQKQVTHFSAGAAPAWAGDHRPVEMYSWAYIRGSSAWPSSGHDVASSSSLDILRKHTGVMFDLPTEAQWEYACRAGTGTGLNNGKECIKDSANADEVAWHRNNIPDVTQGHSVVGLKLPNAWGLYDMHGNVAEFCLDWYATGDDYVASFGTGYKAGDTVVDPMGPTTGTMRVLRGGSIYAPPQYSRSAARGASAGRAANIGFRLCCPAEF